jgi:HK97 family phage portal protein
MFGKLLEQRVIRDPYWNMWGAGADITPYGDIQRGLNAESALRLLTVYACVKFIADSIAMLPLEVYRQTGKLRTLVDPKPRWLDMPNAEQPRQEFIGQALTSLLLEGNFYALIIRNDYGQVAELWPLHPQDVVPRRAQLGAPVIYDIHQQGVTVRTAGQFDIMHVKGLSLPGDIKGRNPIQDARESIGLGLEMQDFAEAFFKNGASLSGSIEYPVGVPADADNLSSQFNKMHQGSKKSNKVAVFTQGGHFNPISVNPDDAQFLESRNFTGAEIAAGLFGLHPEMIGLTHGIAGGKDITYQNLESRWVELVRRALQPWMTRLEFAFSTLLPGYAMNGQKARFNVDEYLRADIATRFQAYSVGIASKFMLPNEARENEDLPPIAGGDKFEVPPAPVIAPAANGNGKVPVGTAPGKPDQGKP